MPMSEAQRELADRVRAMLSDAPDLTEKAMFGSRAFLLAGKIVVAVFADSSLLVRVDADETAELSLEPGASPAVMGRSRREMGPGWMQVERSALADDDRLLFWLDAARDFHRGRGERAR